jgi:hypothetical protein
MVLIFATQTFCVYIPVSPDIESELPKKFTEEESSLLAHILLDDKSFYGSLSWFEEYVKNEFEKGCCTSIIFTVLFEYPDSEFPSDCNAGNLMSDVTIEQQHSLNSYCSDNDKYITWFTVGRLSDSSFDQMKASVKMMAVWSFPEYKDEERYQVIEGDFARSSGKWEPSIFYESLFVRN